MAGDPNDCSNRTILLRDIIPEFAIEMAAQPPFFYAAPPHCLLLPAVKSDFGKKGS